MSHSIGLLNTISTHKTPFRFVGGFILFTGIITTLAGGLILTGALLPHSSIGFMGNVYAGPSVIVVGIMIKTVGTVLIFLTFKNNRIILESPTRSDKTKEEIPEIEKSASKMDFRRFIKDMDTFEIQLKKSPNTQNTIDLKLELESSAKNYYTIFKNTFRAKPDVIELDTLASTFGTTEEELVELFEYFHFPKISYTNGPCLNAFFVGLCNHLYVKPGATSLLKSSIIPGLMTLYTFSYSCWPANKKPSFRQLTIDEFSSFIGFDPVECRKGFVRQRIRSEDDDSLLTEDQMEAFCDFYNRGNQFGHNTDELGERTLCEISFEMRTEDKPENRNDSWYPQAQWNCIPIAFSKQNQIIDHLIT